MAQTELHCLHGFLGRPEDWARVLPRESHDLKIITHSLSDFSDLAIEDFGRSFNRQVRASSPIDKKILVGYSLGGRLALHALIHAANFDSTLWSQAVVISAHPGLSDPESRKSRAQGDELWAGKFQQGDWDSLMNEWHAQPVFAETQAISPKVETAFDRSDLARMLRGWSLARQENLLARLETLPTPVTFVAGEKDLKFTDLMKRTSDVNPRFKFHSVPFAGHRASWDQPDHFKKLIEQTLISMTPTERN